MPETENIKILLLEDDENLGLIIKEHLILNGYDVTLCKNGQDGLAEFEKNDYNLCLADIMMPRMDGFTFTSKVRRKNDEIPIIFLTAKSLQEDKIKGFKIGCDDYVTKPFSVEELLLRIKAVLKRNKKLDPNSRRSVFEIGNIVFDSNRRLLKSPENETKLTTKETELLKLLCHNQNQTLSRKDALQEIWGSDTYFNSRSMDVFIAKLRKYLKDDPRIEILNIHGEGFNLIINQ